MYPNVPDEAHAFAESLVTEIRSIIEAMSRTVRGRSSLPVLTCTGGVSILLR